MNMTQFWAAYAKFLIRTERAAGLLNTFYRKQNYNYKSAFKFNSRNL